MGLEFIRTLGQTAAILNAEENLPLVNYISCEEKKKRKKKDNKPNL